MKNIIIAALLLVPAAAGAQGNIKFGNLEINPFVSVNESYDSNIYLETAANGRSSAMINRSVLGVGLNENFGSRYDLKAGYNVELLSYSRDTDINNAAHQNADLAFSGKLPKDMTLTVDNKYKRTTDQATSQLTERAKREENTVGFRLNAPLRGKFGFALAAQHVYNNYYKASNDMLDRSETQFGADLTYKWQPKTQLFLAYRHGMLDYNTENANDADYDNIDLGVTGRIAPKLMGTVAAGLQMRKYDQDLNSAKDDATTGGYSAQLKWTPQEKTDVVLYGKRANVETNYGDARFYTSTLTDIFFCREVRKVKLGLGLTYEDLRYSDKNDTTVATQAKRADENASVRVTAEYNLQKWLVANFGYTYKDRSSNFDQFEYKDNIVSLGLKAMF